MACEVGSELLAGKSGSTVSGGDQHHPMSQRRRAGHGARGEECLIIGVGMNECQRGHRFKCRVA